MTPGVSVSDSPHRSADSDPMALKKMAKPNVVFTDAFTAGDFLDCDITWDSDGVIGLRVEEDGGPATVILDRATVAALAQHLVGLLAVFP